MVNTQAQNPIGAELSMSKARPIESSVFHHYKMYWDVSSLLIFPYSSLQLGINTLYMFYTFFRYFVHLIKQCKYFEIIVLSCLCFVVCISRQIDMGYWKLLGLVCVEYYVFLCNNKYPCLNILSNHES